MVPFVAVIVGVFVISMVGCQFIFGMNDIFVRFSIINVFVVVYEVFVAFNTRLLSIPTNHLTLFVYFGLVFVVYLRLLLIIYIYPNG